MYSIHESYIHCPLVYRHRGTVCTDRVYCTLDVYNQLFDLSQPIHAHTSAAIFYSAYLVTHNLVLIASNILQPYSNHALLHRLATSCPDFACLFRVYFDPNEPKLVVFGGRIVHVTRASSHPKMWKRAFPHFLEESLP